MADIQAPVFDIQRFSIHDGPGIRTLIFFKGCNLHCDWCQNPESQSPQPIVGFYANRCQNHLACYKACPHDAIETQGFRLNYDRCQNCYACVEQCPEQALKVIGISHSPQSLMKEILRDRLYYENSGGGITLSGGEPTLYPKFVNHLIDQCIEHKIHTVLETCGSFAWKKWTEILPKIDLIYFDLKLMDPEQHLRATGFDNRIILENAHHLISNNLPVQFRVPLVPGVTDTLENRKATVDFLKQLDQFDVHLLGYHNMGESKIDLINGTQSKLQKSSVDDIYMQKMRCWFENQGIAIYG